MWWCYLYSYLKQLSGVLCFPQALPDFFRLSSLLSISNARLLWFFCPCLWDWLCQCHFWLLVSPFLQERGDRDTGLVSDLIWLRSVNATAMAITLSLVGSARFILHPFGFILCFELGFLLQVQGRLILSACLKRMIWVSCNRPRCLMTCGHSPHFGECLNKRLSLHFAFASTFSRIVFGKRGLSDRVVTCDFH